MRRILNWASTIGFIAGVNTMATYIIAENLHSVEAFLLGFSMKCLAVICIIAACKFGPAGGGA